MYTNRTMKPAKTILRRRREVRGSHRGRNLTGVHCMHVWQYHHETPFFVQLIYANKNGRQLKIKMLFKY
jgi:hypothetical protein